MAQQAIDAGAEFKSFDLKSIIGDPLYAAVQAQATAAQATRQYIESMIDKATGKPITVNFVADYKDDAGGSKRTTIETPLLAIVPTPHLRIDSVDIDFKYSISQTISESKTDEKSAELEVSAKAFWGWGAAQAKFKGQVMSKSQEDSQTNRAGALNIRVHASESAMPEGLARMLTLLANTVQPTPKEEPVK
jgi:hypothetical protein